MLVVMENDATQERDRARRRRHRGDGLLSAADAGRARARPSASSATTAASTARASRRSPASPKSFTSPSRTSRSRANGRPENTHRHDRARRVVRRHRSIVDHRRSLLRRIEEQIVAAARAVRDAGATALRGGAFKPRSSPYSFQGLGQKRPRAARARARAKRDCRSSPRRSTKKARTSSPSTPTASRSARATCRTTRCSAPSGRLGKPVLLKRGMAATITDLLMSAEYILAEGNGQVILCERGIRSFDTMTRNLFDLTAIPLVQRLSHLPMIADPSHGTGLRDKVIPMARAAVAAGADGVHRRGASESRRALSDGGQSLYPDQFARLVVELRAIANAIGRVARADCRNGRCTPACSDHHANHITRSAVGARRDDRRRAARGAQTRRRDDRSRRRRVGEGQDRSRHVRANGDELAHRLERQRRAVRTRRNGRIAWRFDSTQPGIGRDRRRRQGRSGSICRAARRARSSSARRPTGRRCRSISPGSSSTRRARSTTSRAAGTRDGRAATRRTVSRSCQRRARTRRSPRPPSGSTMTIRSFENSK